MNKTELYLPSRAAEGFPGSSHRTVADRFRFCTGNGILIERGHQNYVSHISRKFEITYRFKEEGGISSFVDGLYLIMSEREIRGLYTRRIAQEDTSPCTNDDNYFKEKYSYNLRNLNIILIILFLPKQSP